MENIYEDTLSPVKNIQKNYENSNNVLRNSSNRVTRLALESGAIRYSKKDRISKIEESTNIQSTLTTPYIDSDSGEITDIPPEGTTPYETYGTKDLSSELFDIPNYGSGKNGILYQPGPSSRLSGKAGFIVKSQGGGVEDKSMVLLYRLPEKWGDIITINSAYRNLAAQESIYGKGTSKRGYHFVGKAFDCSISGRSNQIKFMNLAYKIGFRGFGSYPTFVHIDTRGGEGHWGEFTYYDLPGPAGAKS